MKVLLVNPPTGEKRVVRDMMGGVGFNGGRGILLPPMDLATLAAALEAGGHRAAVYDADAADPPGDVRAPLSAAEEADAVIASVSLPSLATDIEFIRRLRARTRGRLVAKTGITYAPILSDLLNSSGADFAIVGEVEDAVGAVLSGAETGGTAGLRGGALAFGEPRRIEDLDRLPLPARHLLANAKYAYSLLGPGTTTMQTSRGCVFPCAYYCPYPLVQGRRFRARSPRHVLSEIRDVVRRHGIRRILFRDAAFTLDMARAREICEAIVAERLEVEWWCETRANCLDAGLLAAMRRAGCRGINLGVETGDPELLAAEAKAGVTLTQLKRVHADCRRLGIRLHFLLMVGLPGETRASVYQTYRLLRELTPDSIGITYITPYPGTPLFAEARRRGWIVSDEWSRYGSDQPVMHTDRLSIDELKQARALLCQAFDCGRFPTWRNRLKAPLLERRFRNWAEEGRPAP
jgi:radical SAM superfamily enzyme YgiQ (UPF0313 family)